MLQRIIALAALLFATVSAQAATLYVEEYSSVGTVVYQAAQTPGVTKQTVAESGSSAQSAAFSSATILIRVHTDAICSVEVGGTNPTATTTSARMVAGQTEYFFVHPGDKIAVITNT